MTTEELTRTAYHESGHAVVASLLGGKIDHLSIRPDEESEDNFELALPAHHGQIRVLWPKGLASESELAIREIKVSLAGPVVEMIYDGSQFYPQFIEEWRYDWELAVDRASEYLPKNRSVPEHLARYTRDLIDFFEREDAWAAVAALADELEAHEYLDPEHIDEILDAWPIG